MSKSKRLRTLALATLAVALLSFATLRDPSFKAMVRLPFSSDVPGIVTQFANALCVKDARFLTDHSGGAMAMTYERYVATLEGINWNCTQARYFGRVDSQRGPEYFYALSVGSYEIWFGLTYDPATEKIVAAE